MTSPALLYLHGFCSSPASPKVLALKKRLAQRACRLELWCEQLPPSPLAAIAMVSAVIEQKCADPKACPPLLVGSSLGGFYATWLAERYNLRAVLINPAVAADLVLEPWLGWQSNLYTGERFECTPADLAALRTLDLAKFKRPERFWLLLEEGDTVLDYRAAVQKYAGARQTVLAGGDHSFTRWPDFIDEIIELGLYAKPLL